MGPCSSDNDLEMYSPRMFHPDSMRRHGHGGPHSFHGRHGRHGRHARHGMGMIRPHGHPLMHPRFREMQEWDDESAAAFGPGWRFGGFPAAHRGRFGRCKPHKADKCGGKKKVLKMRVMKLEQQVQLLQEQLIALSEE